MTSTRRAVTEGRGACAVTSAVTQRGDDCRASVVLASVLASSFLAGLAVELAFGVLLCFFLVSAHMLLEISMERAATRLEMLWIHYLGRCVDKGGA